MIKKEELIKIGLFTKPHGIKGELSLSTGYDLADISCDDPFLICDMDGIPVPFFIDSIRQKNYSTTLVGFAGIDSGDKAKLFIGKPAYIPAGMLPLSDEDAPCLHGWNFIAGYTASDEKSGKIGQVTDIDDNTLNILLKVDHNEKELLIPAALVTAVDRERKMIEVSLPEGFWEL
ncbi:MAG: 16S rRNA processing protein RimM [Tannerella sp.]|jgi:16S rRNA processing protein RimM|nr:16S rRNA processing protein RimM [Tannerella sp.]